MNMRNALLASCAALILVLGAARARAEDPLNIVVIDICSLRADRVGAYGSRAGLTPDLDAFARDATTFENAWAQSSWCLPNYATLMTGHRPEVHGLYSSLPFRGLPAWEETVAERMRRAGYRTGGFTAGVYTLPAWGLDRGFDVYANHFSTAPLRPGRFADMLPDIEGWIVKESSRPFFLYATVDDLHAPYGNASTGSAVAATRDVDDIGVDFFRAYNGEPVIPGSKMASRLDAFRRDPTALERLSRLYDENVRSVDRSISRFLSTLKKRGLWDRTLVVITADHGELLGEHGLLGHTEGLYEPVLRVPLLVRHPRYKTSLGARIPALVERIDLTPTLIESGGATTARMELQGRSLLPLLAFRDAPWRNIAYASSKRNAPKSADWLIDERAVRDERWKLIWSLHKDRWELYDLKDDPSETRDLSKERPNVTARLARQMMGATERARTHAAGRPSGYDDAENRLQSPPLERD